MKEDYLQYIWRFQRFRNLDLVLTSGRSLVVLFQGHWNKQSGPDFLESRIRIDKELWIGSTEIHFKSSDWRRHGHTDDPAYRNVVLHVVYDDDEPLLNHACQEVPTLELRNLIDYKHYQEYTRFIDTVGQLPCATRLHEVPDISRQAWLHRMAVERLETRHVRSMSLLHEYQFDWNAVWWLMLCRSIGFGINQEAFEVVARSINWKWMDRWRHQPIRMEALLAGQSGWFDLEDPDFPKEVLNEYNHLCKLLKVKPLMKALWQRGRMKPANRPIVRMGQLMAIVSGGWLNWNKILEVDNLEELRKSWRIQISAKLFSDDQNKTIPIGSKALDLIFANALIPLVFTYGHYNNNTALTDRAIAWMEDLPPEDNHITRLWSNHGWKGVNVLETQGQLHLHRSYCCQKKCLSCLIGINLLKETV